MRIALLSSVGGWHAHDLRRAAGQLGHESDIIDFRRVTAAVACGKDSLSGYDGVIVRTMPPGSLEQVVFRMDALQRAEAKGVLVLNSPRALEACVDKYLALARLESAGLKTPPTVVCQIAEQALEAFEELGGDVVVKPLFGSEGRGMVRVSDPDVAWRTFRTLERLQSVIYLQKFIAHPGWDLRAFVLGGQVLAAMRRHAVHGWRTNVAQGGKGEAVTLSVEEENLAVRAAAALEATAAGVDLLPDPDGGLYVLEVNAVPGWRALAPVTGVDVASELIGYMVRKFQRD